MSLPIFSRKSALKRHLLRPHAGGSTSKPQSEPELASLSLGTLEMSIDSRMLPNQSDLPTYGVPTDLPDEFDIDELFEPTATSDIFTGTLFGSKTRCIS
ncbi:hypothetical protein PENARI_c076G04344 [Penicillium arizonense]|uniref:Uncharacterized protein n=1 Tax=Penicillium arizonense TaxID=1835702 RepID=A0A1F5L1B3_PENAI|nr:hypothetical protein PENARI_c076G04344 [Penicillium arizonense]OGE47013.1 hypothetical protein PENARI_c076G04344 [Penicillium arizonense]